MAVSTTDLFACEKADAPQAASITVYPCREEDDDDRALRRIRGILTDGHVCVLAYSGGKDSSCLASLLLLAAVDLKRNGHSVPPIIITHSQTGVESPEVSRLAFSELDKMKEFSVRHGIDVRTEIAFPALNDSFPVRVIGGRALPSFVGGRADCSWDWKCLPNRRLLDSIMAGAPEQFKDWKRPVVMTGVRSRESHQRDQRIEDRGEVAEGLWQNEFGDLRASPILDFSEDSVWTHIGFCSAGVYQSYSDFEGLMNLYKDAGGDSCVIVADMKMSGNNAPCGVRTGCWSCARTGSRDRSLEQMIDTDPLRYGYMRPLNRLRNWLVNTQYDWSMRQFVGRTIDKEGFIEIGADTYSPDTLKKLLVYTLTAEKLSGVSIISYEQLIAIDARWSMYALTPPFTAVRLYLDLIENGGWEEAPIVNPYPKTEVPKIGRVYVGKDWYEATGLRALAGLRDTGLELFSESCGFPLKSLSNGAMVCDYPEEDQFSVDPDGAADFISFLAEDYIRDYCHEDCSDWTFGFKTYLRLGLLAYGRGQGRTTDGILRRSQWRQTKGLHGQQNPEELIQHCTVLHKGQLRLL